MVEINIVILDGPDLAFALPLSSLLSAQILPLSHFRDIPSLSYALLSPSLMVVDADESKKMNSNLDHENSATKSLKKRKRASSSSSLMEGLFKYYKEVSDDKINLDLNECGSSNSAIAYLLEETTLSLSKLVDQIYEKMRARESGSASGFSTTVAFVKSTMLFIGHRSLYGVPNADGDILEDETESCLWCWEFCAITVPGFEENRKARLQDLAVLTGGNLITEELGMNLENVDLDMLGSSKKAIISNHDTVVIDGAGDKEALEDRCEQIRSAIDLSTSDSNKEKLQERLAKLSGGVAVLKHHYVICFIWFNNFNGNNGED